MRQEYTHRIVIAMTALLAAAAVLFALGAIRGIGAPVRSGTGLEVEPDTGAGRALFVERADAPCGRCHTLRAADASGKRASNLDELRPTREQVIASIMGGHIAAHETHNYRAELTEREIADLASYVARVAGKTP